MSQHDMEITTADANTGTTVRAAINAALQALVSLSSGASAPSTTYAYQFWADTTTGLLKIRNAANNDWVIIGTLASTYLGAAMLAVANEFTQNQKIKGDALGLRIYDTGGSGKEYLIRSDGGNIEICENTGTEGSPTWTVRVTIGTNVTISGDLRNAGSTALGYTTITSSGTAADYTTYFINASSGEVILTLPSAATYAGRIYHIVRTQTYPSAYNCIIACQSGEKINGEASLALENNYDRVVVQSNGSNWIIIGR